MIEGMEESLREYEQRLDKMQLHEFVNWYERNWECQDAIGTGRLAKMVLAVLDRLGERLERLEEKAS